MATEHTGTVVRHANLTASGLERAERCPWAYALPSERGETTRAAERGTAIHRFLELLALGSDPHTAYVEASEMCPEAADTLAGIDPAGVLDGEPEVAFALDVVTGKVRRLDADGPRGYGKLGPHEVAGTADLITPPDKVLDYKTGTGPVTAASDNLQLAFHAVCMATLYGSEHVDVSIVKVKHDGSFAWDTARLDALDISEAYTRIRNVMMRVMQARELLASGHDPEVNPGQHCQWCPAASSCPSMQETLNTLSHLTWLDAIKGQLATEDGAAYWWERVARAKQALALVEDALKARLAEGPIDLPTGETVSLRKESRKRIDGKVALRVLRDSIGPEAAEEASEVRVTQASIKRACGDLTAEVFKALESAGAIQPYTIDVVRTAKRKSA